MQATLLIGRGPALACLVACLVGVAGTPAWSWDSTEAEVEAAHSLRTVSRTLTLK